jgi:hypothetical protein
MKECSKSRIGYRYQSLIPLNSKECSKARRIDAKEWDEFCVMINVKGVSNVE